MSRKEMNCVVNDPYLSGRVTPIEKKFSEKEIAKINNLRMQVNWHYCINGHFSVPLSIFPVEIQLVIYYGHSETSAIRSRIPNGLEEMLFNLEFNQIQHLGKKKYNFKIGSSIFHSSDPFFEVILVKLEEFMLNNPKNGITSHTEKIFKQLNTRTEIAKQGNHEANKYPVSLIVDAINHPEIIALSSQNDELRKYINMLLSNLFGDRVTITEDHPCVDKEVNEYLGKRIKIEICVGKANDGLNELIIKPIEQNNVDNHNLFTLFADGKFISEDPYQFFTIILLKIFKDYFDIRVNHFTLIDPDYRKRILSNINYLYFNKFTVSTGIKKCLLYWFPELNDIEFEGSITHLRYAIFNNREFLIVSAQSKPELTKTIDLDYYTNGLLLDIDREFSSNTTLDIAINEINQAVNETLNLLRFCPTVKRFPANLADYPNIIPSKLFRKYLPDSLTQLLDTNIHDSSKFSYYCFVIRYTPENPDGVLVISGFDSENNLSNNSKIIKVGQFSTSLYYKIMYAIRESLFETLSAHLKDVYEKKHKAINWTPEKSLLPQYTKYLRNRMYSQVMTTATVMITSNRMPIPYQVLATVDPDQKILNELGEGIIYFSRETEIAKILDLDKNTKHTQRPCFFNELGDHILLNLNEVNQPKGIDPEKILIHLEHYIESNFETKLKLIQDSIRELFAEKESLEDFIEVAKYYFYLINCFYEIISSGEEKKAVGQLIFEKRKKLENFCQSLELYLINVASDLDHDTLISDYHNLIQINDLNQLISELVTALTFPENTGMLFNTEQIYKLIFKKIRSKIEFSQSVLDNFTTLLNNAEHTNQQILSTISSFKSEIPIVRKILKNNPDLRKAVLHQLQNLNSKQASINSALRLISLIIGHV